MKYHFSILPFKIDLDIMYGIDLDIIDLDIIYRKIKSGSDGSVVMPSNHIKDVLS